MSRLLLHRLAQVRLTDDIVAVEHAARQVARHRHRDALGDTLEEGVDALGRVGEPAATRGSFASAGSLGTSWKWGTSLMRGMLFAYAIQHPWEEYNCPLGEEGRNSTAQVLETRPPITTRFLGC